MQIIEFKCLGCYCFDKQEKNFISDVDFNFIEGSPMSGKTSYFLALKGVCEVLAGKEVFFNHIQENFLKHKMNFSIHFILNKDEWNGSSQTFRYSVEIDESGEITYEALDKMITSGMRDIVFERNNEQCRIFGTTNLDHILEEFQKESRWQFKPFIGKILSQTEYSKITEAFNDKVRFVEAKDFTRLSDIRENFWINNELFTDTSYTSVIAKYFKEFLGINGKKLKTLATKDNFLNEISSIEFDYFTISMLKFIILCAAILDSSKNEKVFVIDDLHLMLPYEYRDFLLKLSEGLHPKIVATMPKNYFSNLEK